MQWAVNAFHSTRICSIRSTSDIANRLENDIRDIENRQKTIQCLNITRTRSFSCVNFSMQEIEINWSDKALFFIDLLCERIRRWTKWNGTRNAWKILCHFQNVDKTGFCRSFYCISLSSPEVGKLMYYLSFECTFLGKLCGQNHRLTPKFRYLSRN